MKWGLMIFLFFLVSGAYAQVNETDDSLGEVDLSTLKLKMRSSRSSDFLIKEWLQGSIVLFTEDEISERQIRYDLRNNRVEIEDEERIRVLEGFQVKEFHLLEEPPEVSTYLNCASFESEEWLSGFFKVLVLGKLSLFVRYELPDEETYVNTSPRDRILTDKQEWEEKLKEKVFIGEAKEAYMLPASKKEILNFFGDQQGRIEKFAKENKLNLKNRNDLIKVVTFFNGL